MKNLDSRINKYSYEIVNDKDNKDAVNLIDKAIGVLSNDGVYGYYVYCKSKEKRVKNQKSNNVEKVFINGIVDEFGNEFSFNNTSKEREKYEEFFIKLSENINLLLFFKDIVEKILIYARYHAKALGDKDEQ